MNSYGNGQMPLRPSAAIVEAISAYESQTAGAQVSQGLKKRKKQDQQVQPINPEQYLTQAEVIDRYQVSKSTLRRMRSKLDCYQERDGLQAWRYLVDDLETHLTRRNQRTDPSGDLPDIQWLHHRIEIEEMKAAMAAKHAASLREILAMWERRWGKQ